MVQFGKKLLANRYEPWACYYLDYQGLKACLGRYKKKDKKHQIHVPRNSLTNNSTRSEVPPPPPPVSDHDAIISYQHSDLHDQSELGSPVLLQQQYSSSSPLIAAGSPMSNYTKDSHSDCTVPTQPTITTAVKPETRDFETFLEDEVEKIGLFFLQIQGEISAELGRLRSHQFQFLLQEWEPSSRAPATTVVIENGHGHAANHALARSSSSVENGAGSSEPNNQQIATKLQQFFSEYYGVAVQLLRLVHFVESNVTGIRKILKKHDKVTKKHLTYQYISFNQNHKDLKHLWTSLLLRQYEGITALNATLKAALAELKNMERNQLLLQPDRLSLTLLTQASDHHPKEPPKPQENGKPPLNPKKRHQPAKSLPNFVLPPEVFAPDDNQQQLQNMSMTPGGLTSKKQPLLLYESTPTGRELDAMMLKIEAARRRLNISSNTFQDMLAAQIVMLEPTSSMGDELEEVDDEEANRAVEDKWLSHTLNLTSTLLYMTNYYVVAPTSGKYSEKLGGDEALAGIIIGMTPIAALVSTILYSWWTSYSYKAALVFASTCSIVGNIFYALGLPCNSLTFVIVGRLLNGFGSARSINRRYIADTFPPRQRTAQSANFVTAGALGMAAGPAIASLLHIGASDNDLVGTLHKHTQETFVAPDGTTTTTENDDFVSLDDTENTWWTPENAPGWFMFVVWSIFLTLLWLYFEDPPKHKTSTVMNDKAIENGATEDEKKALSADSMQQERDAPKTANSFESDSADDGKDVEVPLWKNIPVMTTFVIYFVLKLVLECILSSTATLTDFYFQWDSSVSGIYLAILGLLMLPANLGIAILARNHDDRELIFGCGVAMLLGCCGIIQYTEAQNYSAIQYVLFSVVIFLSTNALEGPNMSLLSKTIPKSWSQGLFNVGLLATEAGTLGRAVGDLLLSMWAFNGLGTLLNETFRTMSICSAFTLALSMYFYEYLEPNERDD